MSECLAQYYFRQIVAGLECLHAQSVVHGALRPLHLLGSAVLRDAAAAGGSRWRRLTARRRP